MENAKNREKKERKEEPIFNIQHFYIKKSSFKAFNTPEVFIAKKEKTEPQINFELKSDHAKLNAELYAQTGLYEVVLEITVSAKTANQDIYQAVLQQAGIFQISGFDQKDMPQLLGAHCADILYPYLRQSVSELITQGGFPPFILAPTSFQALYLQQETQHPEQMQ